MVTKQQVNGSFSEYRKIQQDLRLLVFHVEQAREHCGITEANNIADGLLHYLNQADASLGDVISVVMDVGKELKQSS